MNKNIHWHCVRSPPILSFPYLRIVARYEIFLFELLARRLLFEWTYKIFHGFSLLLYVSSPQAIVFNITHRNGSRNHRVYGCVLPFFVFAFAQASLYVDLLCFRKERRRTKATIFCLLSLQTDNLMNVLWINLITLRGWKNNDRITQLMFSALRFQNIQQYRII